MSTTAQENIVGAHPAVAAETSTAPAGGKLYLETYGCQMNEYDSGLVRGILGRDGYSVVATPEEADVILLNTCAIREKAHEKIYGRVEALAHLKRKNKGLAIGILGCMAQNLGEDLFHLGLPVDIVLGPDNYRSLPELLRARGADPLRLTRLSVSETYEDLDAAAVDGPTALVTIMRGCNNFCSFCVVPYTRGRERSRTPESIVEEIRRLEDQGVREVTLLGQNVNSYRYESYDFAALVEKVLTGTNVARIRFTSPHPHDFPEHLLRLMGREERFCSQIHLPLQSGSTSVLARMKRDYTREEYRDLTAKIREIVPGIGLSTDVIVGFCGETESEFEDTLSLVEETGFDLAYMFRYSERDHTLAKKQYPDDVPEETKLARLDRLIQLQLGRSETQNQREIGRVHNVLIQGPSRRSKADWMGRTNHGKAVIFPAAPGQNVGDLIDVRITAATSATLRGEAFAPVVST